MRTRLSLSGIFALCVPLLLANSLGCSGGTGTGSSGSEGGVEAAPRFVSLGTAPVGGAFYNVGSAIAEALNQGKDVGGWRQANAESTGGTLENLRRLEAGEIHIGMANSSITYFAVRGEGGFDKTYDVKSAMTLFPLIAMFVTKKGSGINSIEDLRGKRVVVGPEGAGFEYFVRPIVEAHGLTFADFEQVHAGMSTSVGYLQDESVAASFLGGGRKSPAISSAASSMDIFLVPYGDSQRKELAARFPSFNEVTVPPGTYQGVDEPFAGLNVGSAHLLVRSDTADDLVYSFTKAIYEGREKIAETHALGKSINAENVVRHTGIDFHPGAIRFYQEIQIWPDQATDDSAEETTEQSGGESEPS